MSKGDESMSIYIRIDEWEIGGVDHLKMINEMDCDQANEYIKNCMFRNELKKIYPWLSFNQKFIASNYKEGI
jgi:histone acetyltransferase (RNA polymerase elongator complex component)